MKGIGVVVVVVVVVEGKVVVAKVVVGVVVLKVVVVGVVVMMVGSTVELIVRAVVASVCTDLWIYLTVLLVMGVVDTTVGIGRKLSANNQRRS